jgi:hypothetical protein
LADFSESPLDLLLSSREKNYVGLHIEQGVPVLDRDLNLLQDLITATIREVVASYIGNGSPSGADGFAIVALDFPDDGDGPPHHPPPPRNDFWISGGPAADQGRCLVAGIEVTIASEGMVYSRQVGVPALTTPTTAQPDPRIDSIYLDVFIIEVDSSTDPDLANMLDVGVQTSVRLKPAWVVRVSEGVPVPTPLPGHAHYVLAEMTRPRGNAFITTSMISDKQQRGLTVADIERRLRHVETTLLPTLTPPQFMPRVGFAGVTVTLTGTNFNIGTVAVRFDSTLADAVTVASPTRITAKVPQGIATNGMQVAAFLSVENAAGRAFADTAFTVLPAPAFAPVGTQFQPTTGLPGTQVTLSGDNFNVDGLGVQFGTVTANVVGTPTARQIVAEVPPGLVPAGSTSATVKITVTTDEGSTVSDDDFRATQAVPAPAFVTAGPQFTPKLGTSGQNVTLNGQNFNVSPNVTFDTFPATIVGTPTPTQIIAQVPAGMTPVGTPKTIKISVTTPGGTAVSTDTFTVNG